MSQPDRNDSQPQVIASSEQGTRTFALDDLVYLNRMTTLGHVLPNAAHEMNNALQMISGMVEMLGAKDLSPDVRDRLEKIATYCAKTSGIIRDLVGFARRDAARYGTVDVGRALDVALGFRRFYLSRSGVGVKIENEGSGYLVAADSQHLQQILLNLILNAEQALSGREDPAIRIAVKRLGDRVSVAVSDNAGGLTNGETVNAIAPFVSHKPEGAGLGLSVAKALTEHYGGRFGYRSDGEGLTVELDFPACAR
jgi:C4-dicarboxylate-specific signal transduction histidine kinase